MKRLCVIIIFLLIIVIPITSKTGGDHLNGLNKVNFYQSYYRIRQEEGYYVNDPDDYGGKTYAGVTKRYNPEWYGWRYIDGKRIKRNQKVDSAEFWVLDYYLDIWVKEGFSDLTNQEIANYLFDSRIHLSNKKVKELLSIKDSVDFATAQIDSKDIRLLRKKRVEYYLNRIKKHPKQIKYKRNWIERALR